MCWDHGLLVMYNLQYQVVAASNYLPFFKLKTASHGVINWESTPHASTPIELILKLKQLAYLLKISICSLGGSHIKEVEVWTSHAENYVQATFQEATRIPDANGADTPVSINKICRLVKLVIRDKKEGKSVGIESVKMIGDFSLTNSTNKGLEVLRVDKLLLELGISNGDGDYEKDLQTMDIDEQTKITVRDMLAQQHSLLEQQKYDELESLRVDSKEVMRIGGKIMEAQRNLDWATAKENYKDMRLYSEELHSLRRKRDRFDKIYETSRFQKMIEIEGDSQEHNKIYANMLAKDQEAKNQNKKREDDQVNFKRMLIHNQYQQIRNQNPPWWEKDAPFLEDTEAERTKLTQENMPPKHKPRKEKIKPQEDPDSRKKNQTKLIKPETKTDKHDFSNPYLFNEGDADMEKYMSKQFATSTNPDHNVLRKYEQLEFLKVLGSKVWLSIHEKNWRQREAAAQSVMDYTEDNLPERYSEGNTEKLFEALLEFAWICCHDKVLTIYMLGLKILSTCLRPPICSKRITAEMVNKGVKSFAPILIQKIEQSNSKAKEVSQSALLSICKHPLSNPNLLYKQLLKGLREEVYNGKIITADKLPARVVSARMQISLSLLSQIDVRAHNINVKQMFHLLAGPALMHSNYEVRITAIELVGELYRFIGEDLLKMVVDLHDLRPGISEMVITRLKKIKMAESQRQQ